MADPVTARLEEIAAALLKAAEATGEKETGIMLASIALLLARMAVVNGTPLDAVLRAVETHYRINEAYNRLVQRIEHAMGEKPAGGCVN